MINYCVTIKKTRLFGVNPSMSKREVSASVVTYNNIDTVKKCVQSLLDNTAGVLFSLSVYYNNSTDGTLDFL